MVLNVTPDTILKLPLSQKLIILGAVHLLIAMAYGYLIFYPKMIETRNLRSKITELQRQIDNETITVSQLPKIKQEREEFAKRLQDAVAQMPNEKEIAGLLSSLSSLGRESGLEILLFKPGAEIIKGFYADIPVDMKVQGGYENILSFFKKAAGLQRIVNISKLNIGEIKDSGDNTVLISSFTATTFRFLTEDDIKKAALKDKKEKGKGK
ncbi:MAG: type 4a pilus biogenesis protein PilO [Deltaproteobacteria bacterium]|nr:type 4a pilus biogenesis protein PilO [Deltaproteobacteria bacterium]